MTVNGKQYRFLNGIGYGIDGYCCQVGDEQREKSTKPVNYTAIAIKGLLFHYKPTNAVVTVDGETHNYRKVWLAPTMVSSVILMGLIASLYSQCAGVEIRYGWLFLYLFLASIVGQFGDLAMSTIKRTVGIKDFSRVLPGHGGILDRFDSFLFAAPFAVLYGNMTGCFL